MVGCGGWMKVTLKEKIGKSVIEHGFLFGVIIFAVIIFVIYVFIGFVLINYIREVGIKDIIMCIWEGGC
jgi:hypothetical protein